MNLILSEFFSNVLDLLINGGFILVPDKTFNAVGYDEDSINKKNVLSRNDFEQMKKDLYMLFLFVCFIGGISFISNNLSFAESQKTIVVLIIMFFCYAVYSFLSIRITECNVYRNLISNNMFSDCISTMEMIQEVFPRHSSLKVYKLNACLQNGNLSHCTNMLKNINNRFYFRYNFWNVNYILSYLFIDNSLKNNYIPKQKGEFFKISCAIYKLKNNEYEDSLKLSEQIYESKNNFYKCIGALLLAEIYSLRKDLVSQQQYIEKALDFSPSEEVTQCIQKHIYAMNNQIKIT